MSGTPHVPPAAGRSGAELDDLSIPVLTDRIYLPALELDIALPAAPTARMAELAPAPAPAAPTAAPPAPRAVDQVSPELIGATDRPLFAAAARHAAVEEDAASGGSEAQAPAAVVATPGNAAEIRQALHDDLDADIETELDRDLIAALNADFEAMLAAESDLDAAEDRVVVAERSSPPAAASDAPMTAAASPAGAVVEPMLADAGSAAASGEAAVEPEAEAVEAPPIETDAAADVEGGIVEAGETSAVGAQPDASPAPAVSATATAAGDDVQPPPAAKQAQEDRAAAGQRALADEAEALRTAVLATVAQRLPAHIDMTLRELMQPAINEAITRLGEDAQVALRIALQELVEQVLREELERRQADSRPH